MPASEMPLKDVIGRSVAGSLPEHLRSYAANDATHVDFTVYDTVTKAVLFGIEVDGYSYHKKGTAQAARDEKKNEIFNLIGLPLLRFGPAVPEKKKPSSKYWKSSAAEALAAFAGRFLLFPRRDLWYNREKGAHDGHYRQKPDERRGC